MPGYGLESGSSNWWLGSCLTVAVIAALGCLPSVYAADDLTKTRLTALIEEGDILSQEAATLAPETNRVKLEGEKVVASERSLLEQSNALAVAFAQYNTDVAQQREAAKDLRERCRPLRGDPEAKQACDTEATDLDEQAAKLEQRLSALEERRTALNARIEQHNAARLKWDEHRRKQDARVDVSELDIRRWVDKARAFWGTEGFSLLVVQAGNPSACMRIQQLGSGEQRPAEMKRIQQCFKAVK
jgi:predicted RNase H-like nuclease (RuvC/YqgF family)